MADPEEERWIGVDFAKESRLLFRIVVGPRMQVSADELIKGIDSCLDKNNELPLFVSENLIKILISTGIISSIDWIVSENVYR